MRRIFASAVLILALAGASFAQDKGKDKAACKKGDACCKKEQAAKGKSCCQQPSKAAALRAAAAKDKNAKPKAR